MNIFSKAAQGLNLTPAQRAFLKLLKLWFYTALSTGVMAEAQYLLNNQRVNWLALLYIAGGAFLLSLLGALDKYWTAQGDLPLAVLTQAVEQRVQPLTASSQAPVPLPTQPAPVAQFSTARLAPEPQPIVLPAQTQRQIPAINLNVPQVPFPAPVITAPQISFGDTGITPALPK